MVRWFYVAEGLVMVVGHFANAYEALVLAG